MSSKSNNQGRAFEYICLITLYEEISKIRKSIIEHSDGYDAAKKAWESISKSLQQTLTKSAIAAVDSIFKMEPLILEDGKDELTLKIQTAVWSFNRPTSTDIK